MKKRTMATLRPVAEFRITPPVACQFEIGGEVREMSLKLTNASFNVLAQSELAGLIAEMFGQKQATQSDAGEIVAERSIFENMAVLPTILFACMAHLPANERLTRDEVAGAMTLETTAYYTEVVNLLMRVRKPEAIDEDPTSAGKPAEAEAISSTSTGPSTSAAQDSIGASRQTSMLN